MNENHNEKETNMNENHNEKETNMILDLNKLHAAIMDEVSNYKFSSYVITSKKKFKMFTDMVKPFTGTNEYFEFVDFEIRKNGKDNMDCVMRFNFDTNMKHEIAVVSLFFNFKPEIECGLELRSVDFYCMSPFYGDDTDEGSEYIVDKNGKLILSEKRSSELSNKSLRIINFIKDSVEFKNLMKKCIYNRYIANPIISYEAKYATLEMDDHDLKEYETSEASAKNMFDNEKQIIGEYSNVEDAKKAIKEHKKKLIEDYLKFDYSEIHVNKFIVDAVFEFEHPTIRTIYKIEEKKSHYEL